MTTSTMLFNISLTSVSNKKDDKSDNALVTRDNIIIFVSSEQ